MINWKVRVKNKIFWVSLIPLLIVLIQQVASLFGFVIDLSEANEKLMQIIGTVFTILGLFGVINDPTTIGVTDSVRALSYDKPSEY